MESNQEPTIPLANNDLFRHMFIEFIRTQTTAQAPHIKLEYTSDPEVFSGEGSSTEQVYEQLESFEIDLDLKITLNLNRIPILEARIAYTFSRTLDATPGYVVPKIQARLYPN